MKKSLRGAKKKIKMALEDLYQLLGKPLTICLIFAVTSGTAMMFFYSFILIAGLICALWS